jgi:pimeloyl-ACP methyl ester carboxylesterase
MAIEFIDRGFEKTLLLIPGWATDYRIFSHLNLDYNYLLPTDTCVLSIKDKLNEKIIEKGIKSISILGFSLGGFVACNLVSNLKCRVDTLILFGVKSKYKSEEIDRIKSLLKKNRSAYLYSFYRDCFYAEREYLLFKRNLLKEYLKNMQTWPLLEGLDFITRNTIELRPIKNINIIIFHSRQDRIVPLSEAILLTLSAPKTRFIVLDNVGHIPFFSTSIRKCQRMI